MQLRRENFIASNQCISEAWCDWCASKVTYSVVSSTPENVVWVRYTIIENWALSQEFWNYGFCVCNTLGHVAWHWRLDERVHLRLITSIAFSPSNPTMWCGTSSRCGWKSHIGHVCHTHNAELCSIVTLCAWKTVYGSTFIVIGIMLEGFINANSLGYWVRSVTDM